MTEREVISQRCLLFDPGQLMAMSFGKSEDKHGRPTIVLTSAAADIAWDSDTVGAVAAKCIGLSRRLSSAYSECFRQNGDVARQLREGEFLPSRAFELDEEQADLSFEWSGVLAAVKRWRGVAGVATPRVAMAGANVLLGTRHEAERAQQQARIDGYFDLREKEITPLTSGITPWEPPKPAVVDVKPPPAPVHQPGADRSLDRIANALEALAAVARDIAHALGRDKRKK